MSVPDADYSKIAVNYDTARSWVSIECDAVLQGVGVQRSGRRIDALDVGCGTGNYLRAQIECGHPEVSWTGLDSSEEMLARARKKVQSVRFVTGTADELPFEKSSFDYAICRASFHHFPDKMKALNEMHRVLRPAGVLRIWGGYPESRPGWWVYRYFPETLEIDRSRFWSADRLFEQVRSIGFKPYLKTERNRSLVAVGEILRRAELRDLSQLALLDDADYEAGVNLIRRERDEIVVDEQGILDLRAERIE